MAMRFVNVETLIENGSANTRDNQPVVVPQTELAEEWVISSALLYPQPTIVITQIGSEILPKPKIVDVFWEYLESGKAIHVIFDRIACTGFVILHQN